MFWVAYGLFVITFGFLLIVMREWKKALDGWRVAQDGWRDACLDVANYVRLASTTSGSAATEKTDA